MKSTKITVQIPEIFDQTYDLTLPKNKDKDIAVILTTTKPVTEVIAQDGSKITGKDLQKETVVKTTLGDEKRRIAELEKAISDAIQFITDAQGKLDALNVQLPDIQSAVDDSVKDWKPIKP